MIEEKEFELIPAISPSDKEFRKKLGAEEWEKLKSKALRDSDHKCKGCGFEPYDVDMGDALDVHVVREDEKDLSKSEVRVTCVFCHMIEHADAAISRGYVSLVNSKFNQGELVNICRNSSLASNIKDGNIRILKKTLEEYLEELETGRSKEGKVKLVFTQKFLDTLS